MELERSFILKTNTGFFIFQLDRDQRKTHESSH